MNKQFAIAAAVAMTVALLPSSANAADEPGRTTVGIRTASHGVGDNRGRYQYEILPKQSRQDAVAVYNYSLKPVTVRLISRDATSSTDGEFSAQPSKDTPRDVGAWIAISEPVLHLEPRSMAYVPFQVGVPYDATPGDHVGSILVTLLATQPKPGSGNVVVEHRVGLRVYLRVPGSLKPALSIEKLTSTYEGSWKSLGFGHSEVDYVVRNTGNVRLSATQQVEMLRSFGLSSTTAVPVALKELLPNGFAVVHQSFPGTWAVGHVTAKVRLSPEGLDKSVSNVPDAVEETSVFVFPWLLLLILAFVVAVVGGGTRYRRGRRKAAPAPVQDVVVGEGKHRLAGSVLATALLALVGFGAVNGSPAQATGSDHPVWKAIVLPKAGGADDPIELQTSGGCPRPADSILARAFGKGFPAAGENVIGNTKAGVTPVGPFSAPLAFSMKEFMSNQPNPIALSGTYRFVVTCRTAKYPQSYGDYVAEIRFTDPNRWVAAKPVTNAIGQVLKLDENGDPIEGSGSTPNSRSSSKPSSKPGAGASSSPDAQAGSETSSPALTPADDSTGSNVLGYVLIIGGLAIAAAVVLLLWRRRS